MSIAPYGGVWLGTAFWKKAKTWTEQHCLCDEMKVLRVKTHLL